MENLLLYLGSPFTWDKVFKVLRPLPNHVKNKRLLVHIFYTRKVALIYVAVAVFKLFVACFHLGNFRCANASLQVVVVANVEDGANLIIQSCSQVNS